jgi:hypothetical protein
LKFCGIPNEGKFKVKKIGRREGPHVNQMIKTEL